MAAKTETEFEINSYPNIKNTSVFAKNNLMLNKNKNNFEAFCTKQNKNNTDFKLFIDDEIIDQIKQTKFVG